MPLLNKRRDASPLRAARLQRQWSQREMAERVGATVGTVKRWERQITVPGPYFRLKLAALFGTSEEALGLREVSSLPAPPLASEATSEEHSRSVTPATFSLWTVPYLRNPYFTGRDELLGLLDEHLAAANQNESATTRQVALTQAQAMTGLGGIGKTQIAVEYAYRTYEQGVYTHALWINAGSEEAILTSFTALAAQQPAFAAANETNQQKQVNAIKAWLEGCPERWLLIFDNADDLSLIPNYVPRHGNGSILLTTRAQAVGSLATAIDVEKMGFLEGTQLLLRRAQRFTQASDEEVNAAGNLVVTLDHFPLALEQAGAYIEETGCTIDHYLQLYHTHRSALLAKRGRQSTNYPDTVATTWSLSFEKVAHAHPAAAQLLHVCAFLAPDHIPEELLRDGAEYWPTLLQQAVTDPFTFDALLEDLLRFSLVKRLAEDQLLSIHRLVQVVQVERTAPEEQRQWAERIVRAVNDLFPRQPQDDISSWPQCLRYLEQVQACTTLIEQHRLRMAEAADLLDRAGTYLRVHASYPLAASLYQQALRLREELLGAQHPDTASSLHNLGVLYWKQGKYEQAEASYQQALAIKEEQLGAHHPETAKTLNNLGTLYYEQGKYEQAEPYYHQALAIKEEQLGARHPGTALTLNNLGVLYYCRGKYEQAEAYYQRALSIREEQLGPQHPEVAETLNNLGILYSKQQGKYEQAEAYYQRALTIQEEWLGAQHPGTALILNNLGNLYANLGKYEQVELYYQRALAIYEEQLGVHHPATARTLNNLGNLYAKQGKYEQAEPYYHRALAIQEMQLGAHHPETAETLNNLGLLCYEQRKYEQAEPYYHRALAIQEMQLGAHHPETAKTLTNLAEMYRDQHEYEQAKPLFARAFVIQEHALTANHPDLAKTLHGFARFYEAQGTLQTAVALYQWALSIREQVYGPYHAKTSETRERLQTVLHLLEKEGQQEENPFSCGEIERSV